MLALHHLAAARGEGLHPALLALFRERAAQAADPRVTALEGARPDTPVQAGPCPSPPLPDFLPGNVVRLAPAAAAAAQDNRKRAPAR